MEAVLAQPGMWNAYHQAILLSAAWQHPISFDLPRDQPVSLSSCCFTGATPLKGVKKYPNGFIVENVSMGDPSGKLAKAGKKVSVKYIGKLEKSGQVFDKTKGEKPFTFRLGVGEVIKG